MNALAKKLCARRAINKIDWKRIQSHDPMCSRKVAGKWLIEACEVMITSGIRDFEMLPWIIRMTDADDVFTVTIHYAFATSDCQRKLNGYLDVEKEEKALQRILDRYIDEEKYELAALVRNHLHNIKNNLGTQMHRG